MEKFCIFFLSFSFLLVINNAYKVSKFKPLSSSNKLFSPSPSPSPSPTPTPTPTPSSPIAWKNGSSVCDPKRFENLGLDMKKLGFCDKSLPFEVRSKELIDRMTLDEKIGQLGDIAFGVPRLGLPPYNWWSEALHGVSNVGHATFFDNSTVPGATSFPTVILTSASFNESLWKRIGQAVSTEARAMYNLGVAGLTFWSPNINVVRDPRWGRTLETPGEDPFVVGTYAVNYVRGLQDVQGSENPKDLNSRPLKIAACCKHYAAYDLDNWLGVDRYHFNAKVTEQDMIETFLAPFEMCVKEGDVSSVMCSYNQVNGIPSCADPRLLKQTVRDEWGLHGYIVSDCDSIEEIYKHQQWLSDTQEEAVAQVLKAGLDLDCGMYYTNFTKNAVVQGKVREGDINNALRNLYVVLMRLGFFDGSPMFESLHKDDICSKEHIELAAEAAREGIVLLKNDNDTLPLRPDHYKEKHIAIIGPHANATDAMIGNYAGVPCRYTSPLDGFNDTTNVIFEPGCLDVACKNETHIFKAMQAAKKADATIIFAGIDLSVEAESLDRVNLSLPGYQEQLINQTAMVAKGPVILVILSAGGIDIGFAKGNPSISSIIWAGYPGEEGGKAIADVIYGNYNPGGRLPVTWYEANYVDQLPMTSMPLRPIDELGYPGRTYKFFNGSTVYAFGYGLSYSTFNYTLPASKRAITIKLNQHQQCHNLNYTDGAHRPPCPSILVDDMQCKDEFNFDVQVQNNRSSKGNHVILVYSKPPNNIIGTYLKKVIGFKRVAIPARGSQTVNFNFNICKSLSIVDYAANNAVPSGEHTIILDNGVDATPFPLHIYLTKVI